MKRALVLLPICLLPLACGDDHSSTSTNSAPATTTAITRAPDTTAAPPDGSSTSGVPVSTGSGSTEVSSTTVPDSQVTTSAAPPAGDIHDIDIALDKVAEADGALGMAVRPGDPALYIVGRTGAIWQLRDGELSDDPVANLTVLSGGGEGEQGLLSLAFSPDGSKAYVQYTSPPSGDVQLSEFTVDANGGFDISSQRDVLTVPHAEHVNHNGGFLTFGPDGLLYMGVGDGGGFADPLHAGQDLTTLLGKILRIDPTPSADLPYTIPADNPFVELDDARPEIWAYGLRNPWRYSFDLGTGDLWIGDVGQDSFEEVDYAPASEGGLPGANYGWSGYEGEAIYNRDQLPESQTPPIYVYPHEDGNTVIVGGYVYRGGAIPDLVGSYLFADNASGRIWLLRRQSDGGVEVVEAGQFDGLASFGQDQNGELYVLSVTTGDIAKIVPG